MSSPPSPQQLCLRWNNHQSALVSVFDHLLQNEAFVDVTFAVEGTLVRAHKLVLSACSPYFQIMLASHPSKHPIIILQEVCYSDFRALLDFMYKGEVAVDQDRLPAVLRLAENLKIRGLAEFCDESNVSCQSDRLASRASDTASSPGFVFDSLTESERRLHQGHLASSVGVDLLSQSTAFTSPALLRRPDISAVDFSLANMGLFSSPLAFAGPKNRFGSPSLSSSSSSKWPSELQTYAHHRRKRGRPPRHSGPNRSAMQGSDSNAHKIDGASSDATEPKKVDENPPLTTDGTSECVQITETANSEPLKTDNDSKGADDGGWKSVSPAMESHVEVAIDEDMSEVKTDGEPAAGTSREGKDDDVALESPDVRLSGGKSAKRLRGRPRSHAKEDASLREEKAGPSCSGASSNTEQLQEMSVRGLNLFRYATISEEGVYHCIPCEKEQITRTFKNKYSFQRHAYLYHEGNQRKVFPCLVCGREFSRPDKLKHHLKTVHDYAVPREYGNAYYSVP